ncbi:MAG: SRPBCC family protein [Parvibaculaceae bacterium]
MQITVRQTIKADAATIFGVLTDIEAWADFMSGIKSAEKLTEGPLRRGSRFRETRMLHGREAREEMTVALLEAPVRLVLTADNHGAHYEVVHEIAAHKVGSELVVHFSAVPQSRLARLMAPLFGFMGRSLERQIARDLTDIARESEGRAR